MKTTKELLGGRIKELRKAKGISQEKLAEIVDVDVRHMSRIESGRGYPSLDALEAIANALEVELRELFEFDHLEAEDERAEQIQEMVKELNEDDQRKIFRIVRIMKGNP